MNNLFYACVKKMLIKTNRKSKSQTELNCITTFMKLLIPCKPD